MQKEKTVMLIDGTNEDIVRVASVYNNQLQDIDFYENLSHSRGSIHFGIVTKVLPSLQAVFVKYKKDGRDGFLPFSEIDPVYFLKTQIIEEEEEIDETVFSDSELNDINRVFSEDKEEELENNEKNDNDTKDFINNFQNPVNHYQQGFISKNQIIMVQIVKEERDTKGAMLSTFITLQGRYCSYMPNRSGKNSISRNATNLIDRRRLEIILKDLKLSPNSSVIIGSSGIRRTTSEIKQDFNYLIKLWEFIKKTSSEIKNAPAIIYQETSAIRNIFNNINGSQVSSIIIEGEKLYQHAIDFARSYANDYLNIIKLYNLNWSIFSKYKINDQINNLFSNIVGLKSGGYVVIDKTEALISIDVNSGKNKEELCIEETALKTNIEAIQEIMNQIKLRKMSGLIVVDLIGMKDPKNNKTIENIARRIAQYDKSKTQTSLIYEYSLLIISRQRTEQSLFDVQGIKCQHCQGRGIIKSTKFVISNLFDDIKDNFMNSGDANFHVFVNEEIFILLLNEHRAEISNLEKLFNCKISFSINKSLDNHLYKIERIELPKIDDNLELEIIENNNFSEKNKQNTQIKKTKEHSIINSSILKNNELGEFLENKDIKALDKNSNKINNDLRFINIEKIWNEWFDIINNN
jgi:ribonuclease E